MWLTIRRLLLLLLPYAMTALAVAVPVHGQEARPDCNFFNQRSETYQTMWSIGLMQGFTAAANYSFLLVPEATDTSELTSAERRRKLRQAYPNTDYSELTLEQVAEVVPEFRVPVLLNAVGLPLNRMDAGELRHRLGAICSRISYRDSSLSRAFLQVLQELQGGGR